jgi:hypothetical protein
VAADVDPIALLRSLGRTPAEVAASLRRDGARGLHTPSTCPVAVWMRARGVACPMVSSERIGWSVGYSRIAVETPPAVAAFVRAFDSGEHPDLAA